MWTKEHGEHARECREDDTELECADCGELYDCSRKECPHCQVEEWMEDPVKVDQMMSHFLQGVSSGELALLLVELTTVPRTMSLTLTGAASKELMRYVKLARVLRQIMKVEFREWVSSELVPYYSAAEERNEPIIALNAEIEEKVKAHIEKFKENYSIN